MHASRYYKAALSKSDYAAARPWLAAGALPVIRDAVPTPLSFVTVVTLAALAAFAATFLIV